MEAIKRVRSIDIVRGLVMVIMALDHVRDLMHISSLKEQPMDLSTTTPLLYFTRWITFLCAPTFVFLSGTSAWLSFKKNNDVDATRRFLLTRGIWLIILEFTLINFALWFDIHFRILMLQVIAAIGFGFILLALLLRVSPKILAVVALLIIAGHDLFPLLPKASSPDIDASLSILFQQRFFAVSSDFVFLVAYPLIPWFGMMLLGFACGRLFQQDTDARKKFYLLAGFGCLLLFVLLRFINGYGDPVHWQHQKNGLFTFLSFLSVTKYPPSLMYTCLFLGLMFQLLYLFENANGLFSRILTIYGQVPMFYYLLHLYFIRIAVFIMVFAQGYHFSDMQFTPFQFGRAPGSGISLGMVYLVWLVIVVLLYPLCKWYAGYKLRNKQNQWLRYL